MLIQSVTTSNVAINHTLLILLYSTFHYDQYQDLDIALESN